MKDARLSLLVFLAAFCLAGRISPAAAAIVRSGDVEPSTTWQTSTTAYVGRTATGSLTVNSISDPKALSSKTAYIGYDSGVAGNVTVTGSESTWTNTSTLEIGSYGNGTLHITGGGGVSGSYHSYIGRYSGSTGEVTVAASTWDNGGFLYVGNGGDGTLNITGGSAVSAANTTYVGYDAGSTGEIHFGSGGGTLSTGSLAASPSQLTGIGTVNARGLVSDMDLVFDSAASLTRTFTMSSQPGDAITVNLDMAVDPGSNGDLGAGWQGNGSLTIRDGITVQSNNGFIGSLPGSTGVGAIRGFGSTWANSSHVHVGRYGNGTLNVSDGATVNDGIGHIGEFSGATGTVTVDGSDSTWTNIDSLYVGENGSGTLNITGGSTVRNNTRYIVPGLTGYYAGFIGWASGSTGEVTVSASTWDNGGDLYIGREGSGVLNISNNGIVMVGRITYVGYSAESTGTIAFDNGTLTTRSLRASPANLTGNGTINTRGLLSDVDLVFDANHGLKQTLSFAGPSNSDIAVHLDMSDPLNVDELGAGYRGAGSLSVRDGVSVTSGTGCIGYMAGSTGEATVTGPGSTWTISLENGPDDPTGGTALIVGNYGSGKLSITNGGRVIAPITRHIDIGANAGSTGEVVVDGPGSTWSLGGTDQFQYWYTGSLAVGKYGNGTLRITGGASVSAYYCDIGQSWQGTGNVMVDGAGSTLVARSGLYACVYGNGSLTIINGATVIASECYIGYGRDTRGNVTVDGAGSTLAVAGKLSRGDGGGKLTITRGGAVSNADGTVPATVDGAGSTWTNNGTLTIDSYLNITGGAAVTANNALINSGRRLTLDVGRGSSLTVDGGELKVSGVVRSLPDQRRYQELRISRSWPIRGSAAAPMHTAVRGTRSNMSSPPQRSRSMRRAHRLRSTSTFGSAST